MPIETLRVTAPIAPERSRLDALAHPQRLSDEHFSRHTTPVGPYFALRSLPEGFSTIGYQKLPAGLSAVFEANLTSVLYGPRTKAGNLTEDEFPVALSRMVDAGFEALEVHGYPAPRTRLLQVSRMDASMTKVLPPALPAEALVKAVAVHEVETWTPGRRIGVLAEKGMTATRGRRGSEVFMRMYPKAVEAAQAGYPCPDNAVRAEVERKPRHRPYIEEVGAIMELARSDRERIGEWVAEATAETNLVTARALRDGMVALGETDDPAEALRLCGAASVLAARGIAGLVDDAGISRTTAYRIKRRIETLMVAATGGVTLTTMQQAFDAATVVLARDLVESATGPNGLL